MRSRKFSTETVDQPPRRAVCGTRGSLRTMHGGRSAPSCCAFTHRVALSLKAGERGLPQWLSGKESTCNAGDKGPLRRHTTQANKYSLLTAFHHWSLSAIHTETATVGGPPYPVHPRQNKMIQHFQNKHTNPSHVGSGLLASCNVSLTPLCVS